MSNTERDEDWMRQAVALSLQGMRAKKGGPFGAVVVKEGKIIGRGENRVTSTCDPTAHAEVVAIRDACKNIQDFSLKGAVLYTSCEPCPMCLAAIYWARISKVFYANTRDDAAHIGFDDAYIYNEIPLPIEQREIVFQRILPQEAYVVFQEWQSMQEKTPY